MKFYTRKRGMPQVMIVSLIDIFAILLIFVIVTTTFEKRSAREITIKLPESKQAVESKSAQSEPIVLSITKEKEMFLDGQPVPNFDELRGKIQALVKAPTKRTLALNADEETPYGTMVRVWDTLREAGVSGDLAAYMKDKK